MRWGLRLGHLFKLIFLIILLFGVAWLSGWNYNQKLSYVPFAGTKPEETVFQISPSALFRFLHDEKPTEQLDATEAEMLDVFKDIDKASKITLVEIHQSSMGSATDASKLFHVFNVFKTTSESDGGDYWWWSLEKNTKHIVLQRSRNKDDVKNKLYGDERQRREPIVESVVGKGSIHNLFAIILIAIQERYNVVSSNCQLLVSQVSIHATEVGYHFKGKYLSGYLNFFPFSFLLRNQNVKLGWELWQTIHLANDIPDMNPYRKDEKLFCCAYGNENLLGAEIAARLERINSLKDKPQSWIDKIIEVGRNVFEKCVKGIWKRIMLHHSDRSAFPVVINGFPQLGRLRIESAKNSQEIDKILKEGLFYIDQSDENGETPLFFAIRANNVQSGGISDPLKGAIEPVSFLLVHSHGVSLPTPVIIPVVAVEGARLDVWATPVLTLAVVVVTGQSFHDTYFVHMK
ncbi:hypothetical protein DAPPUDRAFT_114698 [Daphnia pulex]|uniref:Uncharacterized protein n=1 Tax=Daphnia pulex TaxID=6669 RepID=E9HIZ7_DAPPU|nr:hypothetical protein DAPPUDRAFT_114698 [Daphnia pulex]|eukprot:EFX68299.1 hypothetical protein DAPPUDRAFT_114698 [Daphnia pulex]